MNFYSWALGSLHREKRHQERIVPRRRQRMAQLNHMTHAPASDMMPFQLTSSRSKDMEACTELHALTGIPTRPTACMVENTRELTGVLLASIGVMLTMNAKTLQLLKYSLIPNGTDGSSGETAMPMRTGLMDPETEPTPSLPLLPPLLPLPLSPCDRDR